MKRRNVIDLTKEINIPPSKQDSIVSSSHPLDAVNSIDNLQIPIETKKTKKDKPVLSQEELTERNKKIALISHRIVLIGLILAVLIYFILALVL